MTIYIQVNATLKPSQMVEYNKWACTVNGKAQFAPCNNIAAAALTMEEAAKVFVPEECEKITIEYNIKNAR